MNSTMLQENKGRRGAKGKRVLLDLLHDLDIKLSSFPSPRTYSKHKGINFSISSLILCLLYLHSEIIASSSIDHGSYSELDLRNWDFISHL